MRIYDVSMNIHHDMTVYKDKDENRPLRKVIKDFSDGHSYESNLLIQMHTGTHVDAPLHMIEGGSTVDNMDLKKVVTPCKVFDLTDAKEKVTKDMLVNKNIESGDFVIFKTRNSYIEKFDYEFVYLDKSGAEYLQEKEITGVGTDALGIERSQPGHETHKMLLGNGIVILEGLRLKEVMEGEYFLVAAPLKINGAEASPVRAILIEGM